MTIAHKCDRCGALYESEVGQLSIEGLYVDSGERTEGSGGRTCHSWDEIDFCSPCSREVLAVIGTAIDDNPVQG